MASGNESTKNAPKTRQSSLRYHKLRETTPVPQFLETNELSASTDSKVAQLSVQNNANQPKHYQFAMNKIGLFGFLLTLTLVGVLLFSSGFLVAYTFYGPSHKIASEMSQPTAPQTSPARLALPQNIQGLKHNPQSIAAKTPASSSPPASPQPANVTSLFSSMSESVKAPMPTSSMEDKLAELQKNSLKTPLKKEDLEGIGGEIKDGIQEDTVATAKHLSSNKIQGILGTHSKTDPSEVIAEEIPQPPFAIEFGRTDTEQTAREMVKEMTRQGIKAEVSRSINEHGKLTYHVRSSFYNDYETAYSNLIKLTPPFSLWGTIVRGDMKEAPEARR
ncbi:MAG: hypothetical protein IBJ00_06295 [Alphaproteobacteria bacterium]|nr:hypothetical protein [Alphaproteobacteria bacterium]